uniref:Ig-like domain-containing protein n=1 Tax=Oryzias latipes TaxID=8090 RepID=A0A3P9HXB3_ORYLA
MLQPGIPTVIQLTKQYKTIYVSQCVKMLRCLCKGEDKVIQPGGEVIASTLEGTSVTLSYKYPKLSTSNYFFWYRQFQGKPPEFLVSHSSSGQIGMTKIEGLKIQVENKQIDLQMSSAAVTDSAVYYCAVRPTVTGNNKTLYKNLQQHNTTQHPLEGAPTVKRFIC